MPAREEGGWQRPTPLTTHDLQRRRAAWRRRRARRRAAFALLALTGVLAAIVLAVAPGSSHRRSPQARLASRAPLADRDRSLPHRVHRPAPPSATALAPIYRVLSYTSYVRVGAARRREVALTFDDGPGPYTSQILAVLRRTHTPATFFVIGEWARRFPRLVRAEATAGEEVGDHTETHPLMSLLSAAVQRAQIVEAADAIRQAGAPPPHLWRPPYGAFNATTLALLGELRMLVVLWTVDTSDYLRPGVSRIVYTAVSGARPGAIILMHDGGGDRAQTAAALPRIIAALRRRDYRLVTISQLLADDPPPPGQPPPRPLSGPGA